MPPLASAPPAPPAPPAAAPVPVPASARPVLPARGTSVKAVRDALPPATRERSTWRGLAYFAATALVYAASFAAIAIPDGWGARGALALLNGLAVAMLFVVGHDACHGSLTPRPALNALLGRAALLPALHPYVAWAHSHNALHHGWTNLKGKDPVYAPRTLDEFRALPRWRQWLERRYRSPLGVLPLYLGEIWWPLEMRPNAGQRAHIEKRGSFARDRALVLAYPLVQAAALATVASAAGVAGAGERAAVAALGVAVPFLAFSWLIGFATFQHHTHPRVLWYDDEREWTFFRSQVQGTVHVELPRWVERLIHNIMEHTAHHVDPRIPLYHLDDAQRAVEAAYGEEHVIVERFTLAGMRRTFRTCQLYDYRAHRWLTFDGVPTTAPRALAAEAGAAADAGAPGNA